MPRRLLIAALIPGLALLPWLAVSALTHRDGGSARNVAATVGSEPNGQGDGDGTVTGSLGLRAHPHVIEPTAGLAAKASASDPQAATPVGDPSAHARSLAEVKRELKILNMCGGATSDALRAASSQPYRTSVLCRADPGTTQNVGVLPVLTARLDALAKALHVVLSTASAAIARPRTASPSAALPTIHTRKVKPRTSV